MLKATSYAPSAHITNCSGRNLFLQQHSERAYETFGRLRSKIVVDYYFQLGCALLIAFCNFLSKVITRYSSDNTRSAVSVKDRWSLCCSKNKVAVWVASSPAGKKVWNSSRIIAATNFFATSSYPLLFSAVATSIRIYSGTTIAVCRRSRRRYFAFSC